jgi:predicted secreted protein
MNSPKLSLVLLNVSLAIAFAPCALADSAMPAQPVVTVSASATASVPNDRMIATLRAEAENASATAAANDVNKRIATALAQVKSVPGIDVQTASYSTFPVYDKTQISRWHVTQSLNLEGSDFPALTSLVSRLQSDYGLLLSGISFSVSPKTRAEAEDKLTQQAIATWQQRAASAAKSFRATGWRAGRVSIQTSDFARPQPMPRIGAMAAQAAAPVNVEAGTSDVTVTVSGEAVLDGAPPGH